MVTIESNSVTVEVPLSVKWSRVQDLLIGAFEGGSNYWYMIEEYVKPSGAAKDWPVLTAADSRKRGEKFNIYRHADYPVNPGGALVVSDAGNDEREATKPARRLDRARLAEALALWAKECPRHFGDWLAENDDSTTADTFLQIAVLGEIVYG